MAQPYEAIHWVLKNTSAITNLVPANRSYHAFRPKTQTLPNITFYESGGPSQWRGVEQRDFTINCRAINLESALAVARVVVSAFNGSQAMGMTGTVNGFDISRAFLSGGPNAIFENSDNVYNAPVTVSTVYPVTTVT